MISCYRFHCIGSVHHKREKRTQVYWTQRKFFIWDSGHADPAATWFSILQIVGTKLVSYHTGSVLGLADSVMGSRYVYYCERPALKLIDQVGRLASMQISDIKIITSGNVQLLIIWSYWTDSPLTCTMRNLLPGDVVRAKLLLVQKRIW